MTALDYDPDTAGEMCHDGIDAGDAEHRYGDHQTLSRRLFVVAGRVVDAPAEPRCVFDHQSVDLAYLGLVLPPVVAQRRVDRHAVLVEIVENFSSAGSKCREELGVMVRPTFVVVVVVEDGRPWKAGPVETVQRLAGE